MIHIKTLIRFWLFHPALLYGLSFLLGIYCAFEPSPWLVVPCVALWLPFFMAPLLSLQWNNLIHLILSLLTFSTAWTYAAVHHHLPLLTEKRIPGKADVSIQSISLQQSFFGERWVYRCQLKKFIPFDPSEPILYSLPCLLSFPAGEREVRPRPPANSDYWVDGNLVQKENGAYVLKVSSRTEWKKIEKTWSWAERRYHWKQTAKGWIESRYSHPLSGSFLAGLATGEFDDSWMRQQFARFGLQHLLAISGFHFAIIAGFLSVVLRIIPSQRLRMGALLICLGLYCLFLGPQASILRAWVMCSLVIAAVLLEKQTTALNSLGFALLLILGWDPLISRELGFQLSFATTAAILLFYQPAQELLNTFLPKRRLNEVIEMNSLNQHGYFILAFLRGSLALSLAVNLFALPLTLFYFHQFPWMSLLYNLFYPLLASASLCLLLLGALVSFLPPLAAGIHWMNDHYTYFLLQLTYQIPAEIDQMLITEPLPASFFIVYLTIASLGGILWREKLNGNSEEALSFI